ncbi:MAG TPA: efflux RND transporter periplasmic adaptor subunit [Bacteroidales bacterium]|nr:efflux RND transporter periplasmic adaptor subunit [Bacteroidales bacterium]HPT20537.1 efflux RND transporter periplasmic adaptor subunit [Bacteroidales bacterium]
MKIKGSRIIALAVLVAVVLLVAFKLKGNKQRVHDEVAFSQRKVENIPVSIETVKKGTLSENVVASGTLEASEFLNLVSETQGKIIKIYKEKGDRVAAGDVIAKVDDEVIAANVLTAEANYSQFEKDVERLTRLSEENAVTKRDLEQANIGLKKAKADLITAKKALNNTSIKAPISGYINNDFITEGQLLGGGSPVCEIVNNNRLKLNIKVSENEVYKIKVGQAVVVNLSVFPDKKFTGKISAIAEKADAVLKFNVEITLDNDVNAHLKSGLYAEVELPVTNEEKLLISKIAIVESMERPVVYVASNGKAVRRTLIIGQSNNEQVEVLSGLSDGDQVIVSGQLNLKDGDDIKIIQ